VCNESSEDKPNPWLSPKVSTAKLTLTPNPHHHRVNNCMCTVVTCRANTYNSSKLFTTLCTLLASSPTSAFPGRSTTTLCIPASLAASTSRTLSLRNSHSPTSYSGYLAAIFS